MEHKKKEDLFPFHAILRDASFATENLDITGINYCEIFSSYLHLRLRLWSRKVEDFMTSKKPSYQVSLLLT